MLLIHAMRMFVYSGCVSRCVAVPCVWMICLGAAAEHGFPRLMPVLHALLPGLPAAHRTWLLDAFTRRYHGLPWGSRARRAALDLILAQLQPPQAATAVAVLQSAIGWSWVASLPTYLCHITALATAASERSAEPSVVVTQALIVHALLDWYERPNGAGLQLWVHTCRLFFFVFSSFFLFLFFLSFLSFLFSLSFFFCFFLFFSVCIFSCDGVCSCVYFFLLLSLHAAVVASPTPLTWPGPVCILSGCPFFNSIPRAAAPTMPPLFVRTVPAVQRLTLHAISYVPQWSRPLVLALAALAR